jgi:hypothetical protein
LAARSFQWCLGRIHRQTVLRSKCIQRRCLESRESPIIRFDPPEMYKLAAPFPDIGPIGGVLENRIPARYSGIGWILIRNAGRTAALPDRLEVGWKVASKLPEIPIYDHSIFFQRGEIIREENIKSNPVCRAPIRLTIELNDSQIAEIGTKKSYLWLFCRLHYTNFLDDHYEAKVCWLWLQSNLREPESPYQWSGDGDIPPAYEGQRRIA